MPFKSGEFAGSPDLFLLFSSKLETIFIGSLVGLSLTGCPHISENDHQ
jgi:hypothetical protein